MPVHDTHGTVVTAGTPVPIAAVGPVFADWFEIIPLATNTGAIYLGSLTVKNATQGPSGDILNVGDKGFYPPVRVTTDPAPFPYDLAQIGVNADNSGDKFSILYGTRS